MNLFRTVSAFLALAALLGTTVCHVTVPDCPMRTAVAEPCCCGPNPDGGAAACSCPCKKPAEDVPGGPCVVQKTLPSGLVPGAESPVDSGSLLAVVLPAPRETFAVPSTGSFLHPRIEPGWDPGNSGLILPLRL